MSPIESELVLAALKDLKRAHQRREEGNPSATIFDRMACSRLAELLRDNGINPDDHMTVTGESIE